VEVVYRGQWSYGYGPDFRGAILAFGGGAARRGDVEMHVCSSGWARHGHAANPLYERVILHVVWVDDSPDTAPPAPVLELSRYVNRTQLIERAELGRLDESICSVFRGPEQRERAVRVIEAAGDARFEARCVALEGELACEAPGQVLYAAVMECLGYAENKLPFRLLAHALPLDVVADKDAERVTARLRAASGLLEGGAPLLRREQWNLARVRPANHPLRRMLGAGRLVAAGERGGGLVRYLAVDGSHGGPRGLLERLRVEPADGGPAAIGSSRALEIACNAVLPFAVALGRATGDARLEAAARETWLQLPRSGVSRVERAMREHLGAPVRGAQLDKARHQQGLLHLYKRYCAQRLCELCPLARLASPEP
jgi:hypothetical protein